LKGWLTSLHAITSRDIVSTDDSSDVRYHKTHALDAIELWSKVDLKGALQLFDRLKDRQNSLSSKFDATDIACLKARLFGDKQPYSAEVTLTDAGTNKTQTLEVALPLHWASCTVDRDCTSSRKESSSGPSLIVGHYAIP
jgi:hypothetical protein